MNPDLVDSKLFSRSKNRWVRLNALIKFVSIAILLNTALAQQVNARDLNSGLCRSLAPESGAKVQVTQNLEQNVETTKHDAPRIIKITYFCENRA